MGRIPSLIRDFLHFFTMILQRFSIIVGNAGFEPGTSLPQKSGALPMSHHISTYLFANKYRSELLSENCQDILGRLVLQFPIPIRSFLSGSMQI